MPTKLQTDYLVVGAGAAGMAFTDELLAHSDATVTIVDRRHAPGGHWQDAYPFVRLHQPSAFYGVGSMPLGADAIDTAGHNKGFYELAGPQEICAYYERVMHRHFLPSGRVRYFPSSDYRSDNGGHRFVSRLSGETHAVEVARKLVDTTYIEGKIPATTPPPFEVAEGVRCVPVGAIARLDSAPERFVIIGAGKTAMDAGVWLLEQGVDPGRIRWIKSREAWWLNRRYQQPHTLVPELYRGAALQLEAMAQASSIDDLFQRLEAMGFFLRVDRSVEPTMFRGAIVSEGEIDMLRQIEDVVRMGHVRRIEPTRIVLDRGEVPTSPDTVHVHCAANALGKAPLEPIFEPGRVTVQPFMWGFACYQAATLAVIESMFDTDEEKNALCQPIPYWDVNRDFPSAFLSTLVSEQRRGAHEALRAWAKSSRLNPTSGLAAYRDDPRVQETRGRVKQFALPAAINLKKLLDAQAQ